MLSIATLARGAQRAFDRPVTHEQAMVQLDVPYVQCARPLRDRLRFAAIGNRRRVPSIAGLREPRIPQAIVFRVSEIVVSAFKRVSHGRSFAHVGQESFERMFPATAHRYASAAVVGVRIVIRVLASLLHAAPNVVLRRVATVVSARNGAQSLLVPAATRAGLVASQVHDRDGRLSSAQAAACDISPRSGSRSIAKHRQSPKRLTYQIESFHLVIVASGAM
jgi:hypothetical protein